MTHLHAPREFALRHRWTAGRALPDGPRCRGRCAPGCPDCPEPVEPPPCADCETAPATTTRFGTPICGACDDETTTEDET